MLKVSIVLLSTFISFYSLAEEGQVSNLKTFECQMGFGYQVSRIRFNAPNLETAIGLFQLGPVLAEETRGNTFTGASYDLTKSKIKFTCQEIKESP